MISSSNTTVHVSDPSNIEDYMNYVNGKSILKNNILFKFDKVSDNEYSTSYNIVTSNDCDDIKDYSLMNMIFSYDTGYMYFYPEDTKTFIPLVDLAGAFNDCANDVFGVTINVPVQSLNNFFQNMKLIGSFNRKNNQLDLLSEMINYYQSSGKIQKTVTGRLLYKSDASNVTTKNITITEENQTKFLNELNSTFAELVEKFDRAISSIDNIDSINGLFGTYCKVCSTVQPIFDSNAWKDMKYLLNDAKASGIRDTSTNIVFNPTARYYFDLEVDPNNSNKWGYTNDQSAFKEAQSYLVVNNAMDMSTDPLSNMYSNALNSGDDLPSDGVVSTGYFSSRDVTRVNDKKIIRANQLSQMLNQNDKHRLSKTELDAALDDAELNNDKLGLVDTSEFVMTRRIQKTLLDILSKCY